MNKTFLIARSHQLRKAALPLPKISKTWIRRGRYCNFTLLTANDHAQNDVLLQNLVI